MIGDAFGNPLEGASQSAIAPAVERRAKGRGSWGYSDDGAMLLACAEALTKCGTIEPTGLLRALADRYEPARGFGRGMKIALAAFDSGSPWETCAFMAWPEGSIAPVAAARWPTEGAFDLAVRLATRVTHAHEDALAFARLQAVSIAVVLDDAEVVEAPASFHSAILARLQPAPEVVVERLELVFDLVGRAVPASEAARELGTSTLAVESVSAALWSFASEHGSFTGAVSSAALLGGDVDSICCLVGALHGAEAIDPQWVANLAREHPSPREILELADALHDLEPRPPVADG